MSPIKYQSVQLLQEESSDISAIPRNRKLQTADTTFLINKENGKNNPGLKPVLFISVLEITSPTIYDQGMTH